MDDALKIAKDTFKGFSYNDNDVIIKRFSFIAPSTFLTVKSRHDLEVYHNLKREVSSLEFIRFRSVDIHFKRKKHSSFYLSQNKNQKLQFFAFYITTTVNKYVFESSLFNGRPFFASAFLVPRPSSHSLKQFESCRKWERIERHLEPRP